jgi:hypothetical protein
MAAGKHTGKVLVQIRPEEDSKVVIPAPWLMQVHPRYFCNPSYSYIIAGTEFCVLLPRVEKWRLCYLVLNVREVELG